MAASIRQQLRGCVSPFIGGRFLPAAGRTVQPIVSPVDGAELASVAHATVPDVDDAVKQARAAMHRDAPWANFSGARRRDALLSLSEVVRAHRDEFAALESANSGKPIDDAYLEMDDVVECFRWYAGCADRVHGTMALPGGGSPTLRQYTVREAAGVCAMVISFNYPLMLTAWKLAPALACGNAVILKPAVQTPLSSLRLAELSEKLLPPGVLSVLPGGADIGEALARHMDVDRCSFTGSTAIGREVLRASASSNLKRCTLELGGKAAMIVMPDADMARAVRDVFDMAYSNAGQNCCAGTRLLLHADIHESFLAQLKAHAMAAPLGVEKGCVMGPMIDRRQRDRAAAYIERAMADDGRQGELLCGGPRLSEAQAAALPTDYLGIPPTIFHRVPDDAILAREEVFGPVLAVLAPFHTLDEAIDRANRTPFGLAAAIWTQSLSHADKAVRQLRTGTIWVNHCNTLYPYLPFGGIGQSGFGKDLGQEALDEFSNVKTATMLVSD
ncbi:retinal dehydrogenase 2 [Syncephalis pseudoplumigaleata]|uniref:Retinal dehydrogenase 2 n=1 Tax=Syncephalis pseudoplumigaleata TaxID=1712513 RepID=A0A4P9YY04_9FUNG|nr:retinal dehydrogenase 2 [Syncephalis pseudoplumigaleata]|eukprot:RKP24957.1 retinal dehydrogenase 2 [Syncephalis pseudoplumigaleata]